MLIFIHCIYIKIRNDWHLSTRGIEHGVERGKYDLLINLASLCGSIWSFVVSYLAFAKNPHLPMYESKTAEVTTLIISIYISIYLLICQHEYIDF